MAAARPNLVVQGQAASSVPTQLLRWWAQGHRDCVVIDGRYPWIDLIAQGGRYADAAHMSAGQLREMLQARRPRVSSVDPHGYRHEPSHFATDSPQVRRSTRRTSARHHIAAGQRPAADPHRPVHPRAETAPRSGPQRRPRISVSAGQGPFRLTVLQKPTCTARTCRDVLVSASPPRTCHEWWGTAVDVHSPLDRASMCSRPGRGSSGTPTATQPACNPSILLRGAP
jgi:hypothetical protein